MSNFELIDDYLTNRLAESERMAFEQQVASDPSLKADLELQKNIIDGVKQARAGELKAMLNNVPIGAPVSVSFNVLKIAASIIGVGVVLGSLYYYYKPEGINDIPNLSTSIQDSVQGNDSVENTKENIPAEHPIIEGKEKSTSEKEINKVESKQEKEQPAVNNQPKIQVIDPTEELSTEDNKSDIITSENVKSSITASRLQVETDASNKKFDFHYQFSNGKLQLFGPFDKNLYEILEINGDTHAVFLFYKENYYLLDEKQNQITKLPLITDSALIKKLKEYRGK